jgi:hypothetical protein
MAIDTGIPGLHTLCAQHARAELAECDDAISAALWAQPADMHLAKVLISKRMGLRVALGIKLVRLKPPVKIDDSELLAA